MSRTQFQTKNAISGKAVIQLQLQQKNDKKENKTEKVHDF